jgi:outer membrane protein TolC
MRTVIAVLVLSVCLRAQRTLTLREALELADRLNPDVQAARLRILENEARAGATRSAYGPQVEARAAGTYQTINLQGVGLLFPGAPSRIGPFRTFDARPVVRQTVLDAPLLEQIRAAQFGVAASRKDEEAVRETVRLAVAVLYLQAFQADSRIRAAEARLETAAAALAQAREKESGGTASKLDVARAEEQQESERVRLIEARRDREVLVSLLRRTIGVEDAGGLALAEPPAPRMGLTASGEALGEALRQRAEIDAAASRIDAAAAEVRRAERERWPRLDFSGGFGLSGAGPDQSLSTWSIGAALTVPLWTSGRIENGVKEARARRNQAEQAARQAKLTIAQEVEQAGIEVEAAARAFQAASRAAAAARESLELARLRFGAGLTTNLDVIAAQGALAEAEEAAIRARYDGQVAAARLARARGSVLGYFD